MAKPMPEEFPVIKAIAEAILPLWLVSRPVPGEEAAAALRAMADHINHDWSGFNCVDALLETASEIQAGLNESIAKKQNKKDSPGFELNPNTLKVEVSTELDGEKIIQKVTTISNSIECLSHNKAVTQTITHINSIKDQHIRQMLISMGWTPPPDP